MTSLSQAAQDAIYTYRIASRDRPFPICNGTECTHVARERLIAELVGDQATSPRNDMAGLQRLAENVRRGGPGKLALTSRQSELRSFIASYAAKNDGLSPSFREMADGIGAKSTSAVGRLMDGLEERGAIRRLPGKSRSIVIVGEVA